MKRKTILLATYLCAATTIRAATAEPSNTLSVDDLAAMGLEELMDVRVSSVSKKSESLADAPSAVFVITADDIRSIGATSIPEALRIVPGMHVAKINGNSWAVSARGFNGEFADKLLVLIDGRTVYTPLFSGVYWEMQDLVLDDIQRIEVIRGPGASLWGENAVNGVINIITKPTSETKGTLVNILGGNEQGNATSFRHGGDLSSTTTYRAYGKFVAQPTHPVSGGGPGGDEFTSFRTGFRTDTSLTPDSTMTLSGDAFVAEYGERDAFLDFNGTTPEFRSEQSNRDENGRNLTLHYVKTVDADSELALTAYYDGYSREFLPGEEESRDTASIDSQYRFKPLEDHELTVGSEARLSFDRLNTSSRVTVDHLTETTPLYTMFLQDRYFVIPDKMEITVGSKAGYNGFTGIEVQPSIRMLARPTNELSVWTAASRAVKTPSRVEDDINLLLGPAVDEEGRPVAAELLGNKELNSEEVYAYELGMRAQPTHRFFTDITVFYNDYQELTRPTVRGFGFNEDEQRPRLEFQFENSGNAHATGTEIYAQLQASESITFHTSYSYTRFSDNGAGDVDVTGPAAPPEHIGSFRVDYRPAERWRFGSALYYVDTLGDALASGYIRGDVRVAYQATKALELSLVGQNLFADSHEEFANQLSTVRTEDERGFYAQLRYSF